MNIKKFQLIQIALLSISMMALSSCAPEQPLTQVQTIDNESTANTDGKDTPIETPTFSEISNFFQIASAKSINTLNFFSDYSDTFLLRGNNVLKYLVETTKSNQDSLCLVAHFPGSAGDKVLVLAGRVRSYFSAALGSREYFLQFDPTGETINQSDCMSVALNTKLMNDYSVASISYSSAALCPTCSTTINSDSLKIYKPSAEEETKVSVSQLRFALMPALGSTSTSTSSCTTNASCSSEGYNCCLDGQCVNHGAVKPGVVNTSDRYLIAIKQILARPELISNYNDVFFICPMMVATTPTNSNTDPDIDPVQNASDLLTELESLYNCTTPFIDEFSICQVDYPLASELMASGPYPFSAGIDDLNMSGINANLLFLNNITKINYAGKTLFESLLFGTEVSVALDAANGSLTIPNDDLASAQVANLQTALPSDALNDTLSVFYKADGTCEKLGASLARCKKVYYQGQVSTPGRSSDHPVTNLPSDYDFLLPSYANLTMALKVELSGSPLPEGSDTWTKSGNTISFNSANHPIYTNQKIEITYYVTSNVTALTFAKEAAKAKIVAHCHCDPDKLCALRPVESEVAGVKKVTAYSCVYPDSNTAAPPLQRTVYISSKTAPHRFYDLNGVYHETGDMTSAGPQEGNIFEYTNGSLYKPNNESAFVGFNEIYGSLNVNGGSSLPATVIEVERGNAYDLFVDEGAYSSCLNCGTDYYNPLQKIFPATFATNGGGFRPDTVESRRELSTSKYRGDDILYGRACFVPATMIPWTHVANSDINTQRRNRQEAQHFLFANGYNKDWFGFDYGALIGSFDGVTWFAIGSQRRITSTSDRLYLAVNAYFGDLTINNSYKLTINEAAPVLNSGSFVDHDTESDGAECQRSHFCASDNDCFSQLGYDYTCQSVGTLKTTWPIFDSATNEINGSKLISLLSLVGGSNGQTKRCVYRGKGSLCNENAQSVAIDDSYTGSSSVALHTCSANNYCESLTESKFNTKISRFAESAPSQNTQSFITEKTDTFGLATRNLGRPRDFYGTGPLSVTTLTQLTALNAEGMCIPGKDPEGSTTLTDLNYTISGARVADKVNNVGRTYSSTTSFDNAYFSACPATDEDGFLTNFSSGFLNSTGSTHTISAISNNLSTNSLNMPPFTDLNIFNDGGSIQGTMGLNKNSCLRAPGASCFSDFECAPSRFVANKVKSLNSSTIAGLLSDAEIEFWKTDLICSNEQPRFLTGSTLPNPAYDTAKNKCCRETGKEFTFETQKHNATTGIKVVDDNTGVPLIPGYNQNINDPRRYSASHIVADKVILEGFPPLYTPSSQPAIPLAFTLSSLRQYKTLNAHNQKMCCTGGWVRNYADDNGAGHRALPIRQQNIDKSILKLINFYPDNDPVVSNFGSGYVAQPFSCNGFDFNTIDCEIKNIMAGSSEEQKYLSWFGKLELLGIPQVLIETNEDVFYDLDANTQKLSGIKSPLPNTIKSVTSGDGRTDATYNTKNYYSAASYENFEIGASKLKKIYSENTFSCCKPTGQEVTSDTTDSQCCTGRVAAINNVNRCCLGDYTNLSVYTNRYVSSEGAKLNGRDISDSDIDPTSGFIKTEIVKQMAKTMCCSGTAKAGLAVGNYFIPIDDGSSKIPGAATRRWIYHDELDNATDLPAVNGIAGAASYFDAGLRWNNHVYCVPAEDEGSTSSGGSGALAE